MTSLLEQESIKDTRARLHYGSQRWTLDPSSLSSAALGSKLQELYTSFDAAGESDTRVNSRWEEYRGLVQVLDGDPVRILFSLRLLLSPVSR